MVFVPTPQMLPMQLQSGPAFITMPSIGSQPMLPLVSVPTQPASADAGTYGSTLVAPGPLPSTSVPSLPSAPVSPALLDPAIEAISSTFSRCQGKEPDVQRTWHGKGHRKGKGKGKEKGKEKEASIVPAGLQPVKQISEDWQSDADLWPSERPFGNLHTLHPEAKHMGLVSADMRQFTKEEFDGRLSIVTESEVHTGGTMRYAVQFTDGELSSADGVGFIFASRLPCPKNIQKISSIFANSSGRICIRAHSEIVRSEITVKRIELGDWLELRVDLDKQQAEFIVHPQDGGMPSRAKIWFGETFETLKTYVPNLAKPSSGYMAVVVKHRGTSIALGS